MIKTSTTLLKNFEHFQYRQILALPPTIQKILSKEDKAAAVDSPLVDLLSLIILIYYLYIQAPFYVVTL
jgi:hypothetical protein